MPIDYEAAAKRLGLLTRIGAQPADQPPGKVQVDVADLRLLLMERGTLAQANAVLKGETPTGEEPGAPPLNLLGVIARWRGGGYRDVRLPGVPWTAGQVADALGPIMRGKETTSGEIASIASRGLNDPRSLNADEIRSVCASCLTQTVPK